MNPLRLRIAKRCYGTSPFLVRFAQKGEAGYSPSGWSPREMRGSSPFFDALSGLRNFAVVLG